MASSEPLAAGRSSWTKIISTERSVVTALRSGRNFILITFADGRVCRGDIEKGSVETVAQVESAWSLAYRGNMGICGSLNGDIHLLDVQSKALLHTAKIHNSGVRCLEFLDDSTFVSGSKDSTVRTWIIRDGSLKLKMTFAGHTAEVRCLSTYDGLVVSGSYDNDARIWNGQTGERLHVLCGHTGNVHFVRYNGTKVATSSADGDIRVWNAITGTCEAIMDGYGSSALRIAPLRLVKGTLFWGAATGFVRSCDLLASPPAPCVLARISDSNLVDLDIYETSLVCGDEAGVIRLLDIKSGEITTSWNDKRNARSIFRVGFSEGGSPVAVYLQNGLIYLTVL